ncbi:MAG: hypothetical protein U0625_13385 [Phycisphaerales bacterium]
MSRPGDEQPAREAREEHETTVNDRWVGALLESWRVDTPGALDARVGRAMTQLRREARAAARARARARKARRPRTNARPVCAWPAGGSAVSARARSPRCAIRGPGGARRWRRPPPSRR